MLFSIKRILVCTDLSESSEEVVRSAEILRQRTGAEANIIFVSDTGLHYDHVLNKINVHTFNDEFVLGFEIDLKRKLETQIKRTFFQGNIIFREGNVAEEIIQIVLSGDVKYDLLIIGHNSKSGVIHHLIGSVAKKIISDAPIPTLVLKKKIAFNQIASFINGSRPMDWMISSSMDFFRVLKFNKIKFISLSSNISAPFHQFKNIEILKNILSEEISYFLHDNEICEIEVIPSQDVIVAYQIAKIIEDEKIDISVLRKNRGKSLNKFLLGSQTKKLLDLDTTNILILPI